MAVSGHFKFEEPTLDGPAGEELECESVFVRSATERSSCNMLGALDSFRIRSCTKGHWS